MGAYLGLHNYLLGLLSDGMDWNYVKLEMKHHVDKLLLVRRTQQSRLQALCGVYCYLRNGQRAAWQSPSMQATRLREVYLRTRGVGADPVGPPEGNEMCRKCQTTAHMGGLASCPFRNMTDVNARRNGQRLLMALAIGNE